MDNKIIKCLTLGLCFTSNNYANQNAESNRIKKENQNVPQVFSKPQDTNNQDPKALREALREMIESLNDDFIDHEISNISSIDPKSRSEADKIRLQMLINERAKRINQNDWMREEMD